MAVVAAILKSGLRIMPHSGGRVGSGNYFASENSKSADYGNNITLLHSEWLNYGYYDINIHGSNLALANLLNASYGNSAH